ncbi:MAG: hypothetical protein WCB68_16990 [Pyrinomonadaceae bacterium]
MSRMRREVLGWRGPARRVLPSEQWTNWAASLGGQHGRIFARSRVLAMLLALPPVPLFLRSQRWKHYAWNLFPQINLAIGPVLRETAWRGFPVLLPSTTIERFLKLKPLSNEVASARQRDPARMESYVHHYSATDLIKVSARESLIEHERVVEQAKADWPQPLSRVFRRIEAHETQTLWSQKLLAKESLQLVRRVAHERERIERAVEQTTVLRQQKKEAAAAENEQVFPKSSISRMGVAFNQSDASSSGAQMMASSAINIAELTQQVMRQINSQIVARKERRGKSF